MISLIRMAMPCVCVRSTQDYDRRTKKTHTHTPNKPKHKQEERNNKYSPKNLCVWDATHTFIYVNFFFLLFCSLSYLRWLSPHVFLCIRVLQSRVDRIFSTYSSHSLVHFSTERVMWMGIKRKINIMKNRKFSIQLFDETKMKNNTWKYQ